MHVIGLNKNKGMPLELFDNYNVPFLNSLRIFLLRFYVTCE